MSSDERMTKLIRPLRSGQITIPVEFRRRLGIRDDSLLQMTILTTKEGEELRIVPVRVAAGPRPSWLKELYDDFAPVRAEAIESGYTENAINKWIDEAVAEVREQPATKPRD